MNEKLLALLNRYIDKTITQKEYIELKTIVEEISDMEFTPYLEELWTDFQNTSPVDENLLEDIKENIDYQYKPAAPIYKLKIFSRIAGILIFVLLSVSIYFIISNSSSEDSYYVNPTIVETGKGQQVKLTMPDGTKIDLNSESVLSYPSVFRSDTRVVNLQGEGFFDVTKDKDGSNFIVKTESIDIEVLGTSFNVNSPNSTFNYHEKGGNLVEVALLSGSIRASVRGTKSNVVYMSPNEKLVFNKESGEITIKSFNAHRETAWTKNMMIFSSSPLEEIFFKLEEKYGMKIVFNDTILGKDLFTGTFKGQSISDILEVLAMHYNFKYRILDDTITIDTRKK